MTALVRLNFYAGLETPPIAAANNRYTDNGMFTYIEPPQLSETLSPDTNAALSSSVGPNKCKLLRIQLQSGKIIAYRVSKNGQAITPATANDALVRGDTHVSFHAGDTLSVIEVTE